MAGVTMVDLTIYVVNSPKTVRVPRQATILHLKGVIQALLDIEVSRQALYHYNYVEMEDIRTVESYNLVTGSIIRLVMKPLPDDPKFHIRLKCGPKDETMRVKESYSVERLRKKVAKRWNWELLIEEMSLNYRGQEMEDKCPLSMYYICEGSVVEVTMYRHPKIPYKLF